jgi:hypothetical protein
MADSGDALPLEEKQEALERLLASKALGRSEQLRSFLRYVCEAEFEGRSQEINEYALGVYALGRPADYSPAEDSCVRTRAYELRNKLKAYYEREAPSDPVRIEIDKGAYVPRFSRAVPLAGVLEAPGHGLFATPELALLWEPLLGDAPLLITFDIRLFFSAEPTDLVVRHYLTNDPQAAMQSEPLTRFRERMGVKQLRPVHDYADFGAVHAAFLLGRLLGGRGRRVGLKHSASLDWQDLWNSNVVAIGKPHLNPALRSFLEGKDFVANDYGEVHNTRPLPGEEEVYRCAATHGAGEKFALITRVRGPQPDRHVLLLSGSGAELMWALAESITNAEHVREIVNHVKGDRATLPEAFQVVIQATFHSNVPVRIRYVTHHVLSDS